MQALADFPIDPQLIAAVENAFPWQTATLIDIPQAWADARPSRWKPNSKKRAAMRKRLVKRYGNECFYCRREFRKDETATLDHLIPYIVVPNWDEMNLVLACEECNAAKSSKIHAAVMPVLAILVYRLATLNSASVERSLVPAGGAA
jgi:5-methylcytosine-specific restriction endonuclease McrA